MKCGLARQSVAEVLSVIGTVEGGGFPHEQLHQEAESTVVKNRLKYQFCKQ